MKVAFFVYPSAFQNKGGGEILLEKTEEYLRKNDVDIRRFDTWTDKIEDFDILHVFGSVKECLPMMLVARERKTKVVLESIFWSDFRRAMHEEGSLVKRAEMVARHALKEIAPFIPSARKKMFETADIIFPNSRNEGLQISRLFNIPAEKMFVVPNGVDEAFLGASPGPFVERFGLEGFVLSVGRIEPRKNQLNLIRAMKDVDADLVLVGDTVSGYEWYREMCEKEAGGRVRFINRFPHDSTLLASAYAACDTFVLPGWFETPGLAALEAALAGAKVVATDGGSTTEYFRDMVLYIKPHKPWDIRDKIKKALSSGKNGQLKDFVMKEYLWDKIARMTIEGYKKALHGC